MNKFKNLICFITLFSIILSCSDEIGQPEKKVDYPISNPLPNRNPTNATNGRIPTSFLNWETDEIFRFKDPNNTIVSILPPWASGISTVIPDVIRYDYKNYYGWELVYHTFDPTQAPVVYHPILVLYNRYRGLIRVFYYNIKQPAQGSNYLATCISFDSSPTTHLNFASEFSIPNSVKQLQPFQISSNVTKLNSGLATGTWYYFDYEVAYDDNVKNLSEDALTLKLKTWAVQETLLDASGSIQGTLDGYIQASGSGISLFNNLINDLSLNNSSVTRNIYANTGTETKVTLNDKISSGVNSALASSISSELGKLATQGLNFATSPLSKLFNNIVTTAIDDKQRVHLDLSAKVKLKGKLTSDFLVYDLSYIVPGTKRDKNLSGYAPYYDKTLGLFNIDNTPAITAKSITTGEDRTNLVTKTTFTLNTGSFNPIFNPEVLAQVDIVDIRKQIVWFKQYQNSIPFSGIRPSTGGTLVNITAGNEWYLYDTQFTVSRSGSAAWASIGVRISFKVVPKNGSAPVYVVKTLMPQITEL